MMMVMRAGGEFILNISEAGARCGAGGQAAAIIYKQTTLDWIGISIRMSITIRSTIINKNNINYNNNVNISIRMSITIRSTGRKANINITKTGLETGQADSHH